MEKLIFLVRRAEGLSPEEFRHRYVEAHAPLVLRSFLTLRRYEADLVDRAPREDDGLRFDAAGQMWFDSLEDFTDPKRLYESSEAAGIVARDAAGLFGSVAAYRVDERVERDYERTWPDGEPSPGTKTIAPLRRAGGLSHEQFVAHWRGTHASLALKHVLGIWRYVTNVVLERVTPDAPELDGIVEVHYLEARRFDSSEGEAIMREDVAQFLQPPAPYRVTEHILRG